LLEADFPFDILVGEYSAIYLKTQTSHYYCNFTVLSEKDEWILAIALDFDRRAGKELSQGEICTVAQREIKWHNKSMKTMQSR